MPLLVMVGLPLALLFGVTVCVGAFEGVELAAGAKIGVRVVVAVGSEADSELDAEEAESDAVAMGFVPSGHVSGGIA